MPAADLRIVIMGDNFHGEDHGSPQQDARDAGCRSIPGKWAMVEDLK